jgi:hypothetical protein
MDRVSIVAHHRTGLVRTFAIASLALGMAVTPIVAASAVDAPPVVSGLVLSTVGLIPAGGDITASATVTNTDGGTCSVVVSPTIPSEPSAVSCAGSAVSVNVPITLPSNPGSSPVTYSVTLTAIGHYSDGTSQDKSAAVQAVVQAYRWDAVAGSVSFHGTPTGLSCATATVCMVVGTGGHTAVLNPTSGKLKENPLTDAKRTLTAVSCVAGPPVACMAVDSSGHFVTWNGGKWMAPESIKKNAVGARASLTSVSCVRKTSTKPMLQWCVATDSTGGLYTVGFYLSKKGYDYYQAKSALHQSFVSCASSEYCVAVDTAGRAVYGNGITWSAPLQLSSVGGISGGVIAGIVVAGVSCSPNRGCVAIESPDVAMSLNPLYTENKNAGENPLYQDLRTVSCTSDVYCLAGGASGGVFQGISDRTAAGHAWNNRSLYSSTGPMLVSCTGVLSATSPLTCAAFPAVASSKKKEYVGHVTLMK